MLRFNVKTSESENLELLQSMVDQLGINRATALVLVRRGIDTLEKAERFLQADVWHDPSMMTGIPEAVAMLEQAIEEFMPITVYGDYDCDGVCASSIIYTTLRDVGADIIPYIPARHTEGYGLNEKAIRSIAKRGGLLITVDCGITNIKEISLAKELGLQVIVTDHHQVLDELPDCIVIDPTQDDAYPFKGLCGAGVALKLMEALTDGDIQEVLDLAAIATIADIVPLTDENRTIVKAGLRRITSMPRPGIEALIRAAGLQATSLTSENIAFAIAPRINAAGRMGDAMDAFTLLTSDEVDIEAAEQLDRANAERQRIEREIVAQAYGLLEEDRSVSRSTVVVGEGWHLGVIGIAASKIVSITGKPTAVVSEAEDGLCTGSARGIPGVNIFQALDSCKDLLVRYGGHAQAGGFSLNKESMKEFIERFDKFFCDHYPADIWGPVSECDLELEPDEITMEFAQSMAMLEPFGFGNPTPVILVRNARITRRIPMGSAGDHARLFIKKDESECEVVAFRIREKGIPESDAIVDFSAAVSIDHWNGRSRVQCLLREIRPSIGYFLNMIKKETGLFGYGFARNCVSASPVSRQEINKTLSKCKTAPFGYLFKALTPTGAMRSVKEMYERGLLYTAELYWRTPHIGSTRNALLIAPSDNVETLHRFVIPADTEQEWHDFITSLYLDRSRMGAVYKVVTAYAMQPMSLSQRCAVAAQHTSATPDQVGAAIAVFQELGLLSVEPQRMRVNKLQAKKALTESQAYRCIQNSAGGD